MSKRKNLKTTIEDEAERRHFLRIVSAFGYYRTHSLQRVEKSENYLNSLPPRHQSLLKMYRNNLQDIKMCIEQNHRIIQLIVKDVGFMFENVISPPKPDIFTPIPGAADLEKVQATLKQLVRDWSKEGEAERLACYQPIIDEILCRFPLDCGEPSDVKILVPGAGLGRLAYEIASRGYTCQGNEFSLFMLFASNFILNRCRGVNIYKVYPWIHQFVNNLSATHQTEGVSIPDVNPGHLPSHVRFSMAAGDFLEVYTESNEWNCVATCFFIDCANNIVAFLETIYNILKPGGMWVNLGPLLYHFSDIPEEDSIEPSYEVVRNVIEKLGFIIEKEKKGVPTSYAQNPRSMLKYEYDSVFLVCRKPHDAKSVDSSVVKPGETVSIPQVTIPGEACSDSGVKATEAKRGRTCSYPRVRSIEAELGEISSDPRLKSTEAMPGKSSCDARVKSTVTIVGETSSDSELPSTVTMDRDSPSVSPSVSLPIVKSSVNVVRETSDSELPSTVTMVGDSPSVVPTCEIDPPCPAAIKAGCGDMKCVSKMCGGKR